MTALSFKSLQDMALADGFNEPDRANCKAWIVARHAWVWDLEEWTFREGSSAVTFAANAQLATGLPTDFRIATALFDAQGNTLEPIRDVDKFFRRYNVNLSGNTGSPEAFTVFANQLLVGPTGDGSTGLLIYEKSKPPLVADTDLTGLPDGYDLMLVYGAKAAGFKLTNVPLSAELDQDFQAAIAGLRANYLTGIRGQVGQMGAYRPDRPMQWR